MFPHQNNMRERRVGQPPMAPQHLMGMAQQGPSVIMQMPAQQMQIMTPNHFTSQNSYTPQGQGNISSYVPQQVPPQKSNYHQPAYGHNNPQVILPKQTINRNRNYRKDYNVMKDSLHYNVNERYSQPNNFITNEFNSHSTFNRYSHSNGHYQNHVQKESLYKSMSNNRSMLNSSKEKKIEKEATVKNSKSNQEWAAVSQNLNAENGKEKTPMCLVNELARFNKIMHQYRLTNEQGPAHKKSFTVTLTLGTEEYTAEGPNIKKAQHAAAAVALSKTSFSHPTPKIPKSMQSGKSNITPTVELNALAMKRGEPAIYKLLESTQSQHIFQQHASFAIRKSYYDIQRGFGRNGSNNFFARGGRMPMKPIFSQTMLFTVSLKFGNWEFFGKGISPQSARHDAASQALNQLKMLPVPEENISPQEKNNPLDENKELECEVKSPISFVYEIALKRNLKVEFEVVSEKGPPHMKIFVTKCTVGNISATGEGNGKKISKKRAAKNILVELKKLSPLSPTFGANFTGPQKVKKRFSQSKKKSKNIIKTVQDNKTESQFSPISRLIKIQQLKKEKEPIYTVLEERGTPKKREFLIQVSMGQLKATGLGSNKKLAKKAAAQNLLVLMGYPAPDNTAAPSSKVQSGSQNGGRSKKVTFVDAEKSAENNNPGGSAGRQLKPGIYVMSLDGSSGGGIVNPVNMQTTATIAKELLKGGNSPTADALIHNAAASNSPSQPASHSFRPKDQLLYLADLLNFQIHFSDFPKGNHSEFLSLVTMSTDPSHVCHGSGPSIEESQDEAALAALTALSEMGLDSVTAQNFTKEAKKK